MRCATASRLRTLPATLRLLRARGAGHRADDEPARAQGGEIIRHEPIVWVAGTRGEPELANPLPLAMLPQGSVYRHIALEALGAAGRQWSIRSICDSIAGLQAAVFAGLAVAVFPRCAVVAGVRCVGKSEGLPTLPPIELVLHRKRSVSAAAEQLARYIARELAGDVT